MFSYWIFILNKKNLILISILSVLILLGCGTKSSYQRGVNRIKKSIENIEDIIIPLPTIISINDEISIYKGKFNYSEPGDLTYGNKWDTQTSHIDIHAYKLQNIIRNKVLKNKINSFFEDCEDKKKYRLHINCKIENQNIWHRVKSHSEILGSIKQTSKINGKIAPINIYKAYIDIKINYKYLSPNGDLISSGDVKGSGRGEKKFQEGIFTLQKSKLGCNKALQNAFSAAFTKALIKASQKLISQLQNDNKMLKVISAFKRERTAPSNLYVQLQFHDQNSIMPNNTLNAGEKCIIFSELINKGKGTAFDVKLKMGSESRHLDFPKILDVGDIKPGQSNKLEIPVYAAQDLTDGKAVFLIKAEEKRGYSSRPVQLEISTAAMQRPDLIITDCKINDSSGLASGDGDMTVENGETVALEPFIHNKGVGGALEVDIQIIDISPGIELVKTEDQLASVNPRTVGKATLAFRIPRTFSQKQIDYTITASDPRGITTKKSFSIPFEPQAPKLYMTYNVVDEKGREISGLENGQDYRLKIIPRNIGKNIAEDVNLKVTRLKGEVTLGSFNGKIGRIKPDEKAPVITVPVSVARSYQENVLSLNVTMNQEDFSGLSKIIKIPVMAKKPELDYQVILMNGISENVFTQNFRPRFRVSVSNAGNLPATDVKVNFKVNHSDIKFKEQQVIGTIQPGQSQYADFQFFVRSNANTGDLPVQVDITQADFTSLTPQPVFVIQEQSAIRQTVKSTSGQSNMQGVYGEKPDLYINTPNDNFETMEKVIPLHGSIISYGKGNAIERLNIELNDEPLKVLSRTRGNEATNRITFTRDDNKMVFDGNIKLAPGQNKITINGFDRNNKSCTKTLSISKKARLGDIYAVVIGISQFANADYNLNYAASDAKKFYRFLKSDAGGEVSDKRVSLLINHEATRPRIIKELSGFLGRAAPDDTVEIYLATHGLTGADGTLYYLCHDTETDNLRGTGFSDNDLTGIITENISAGKVILYLDACHTGLSGLSKRYAKRGVGVNEVNERINNLAIGLSKVTKTGVATFSATSSGGFSLEGKDWDGGVFTYCLVKGLQGKANENKDEWVTIKEIDNYLTKWIINLTDGNQKPRLTCPTLPIERTPLSKVD